MSSESRRPMMSCQRQWHPIARIRTLCLGIAFLLGISLLCFQPASAERSGPARSPRPSSGSTEGAAIRIQRLRVQIMPEFDDPRVLVIIQGRVSQPPGGFPQTLAVRVPLGAQINQMATIELADGSTTAHPYEIEQDAGDGRWSVITYSLDSAHFFYEYYYDPLRRSGADREFTFTHSSLQPIDELVLEVQEPQDASLFATDPPPSATRLDPMFHLTYHQIQVGSLAAGANASVHIAYQKTNPLPSLALGTISRTGLAAQASGKAAAAKPASGRSSRFSLWLILFLSLAVLARIVGPIWYRSRADGMALAPPIEAGAMETCRLCGTLLVEQALFCRYCGAQVRATTPGSRSGLTAGSRRQRALDRQVRVKDSNLSP